MFFAKTYCTWFRSLADSDFDNDLNSQELDNRATEAQPQNTRNSTMWAIQAGGRQDDSSRDSTDGKSLGTCPEGVFNPRPAGVWISNTSCWGGGGGKGPPLRSPKLLDRFPNFKCHSIALYVNYPYKVKNLTWRSLMTSTGQVKVRIFDFSGLVTSTSKISMLSANKANESAWIVSLTSVSIISCDLWP